MTSRAKAFFVLLALVAAGGGVFAYLREKDDNASLGDADASTVAEAGPDAHKTAAKPKPAGNKKKTVRGGKTVVAGKAGSDHKPHGGAATAAPTGTHGTHTNHVGHAPPHGPSYESVLDSHNQEIKMGANTGPDLTDAQLSHPMSDGSFISECGAPDDMGVTVKVAIKLGRAVGVSVVTHPPSAEVAGCVDRHVRALSWPSSPKLDSFVTTY